MKIGILIGRMQPAHLGHEKIIYRSLEENNLTFIVLGSSGVSNQKNIFSNEQRKKILKIILKKKTRNKILFLEDHQSNQTWAENLKDLIQKSGEEYSQARLKNLFGGRDIPSEDINIPEQSFLTQIKKITFYGGDFKNDSAIKVIKEHQNTFNFTKVTFTEIRREELNISSTKVREALKDNNFESLRKMVNPSILKELTNQIG